MNWRAPWLKDRWLPLILVVLDVVMILVVHGAVARARTGYWLLPGNGAAYATCTWIFVSYILGRYDDTSRNDYKNLIRESAIQSTSATVFVFLGLVVHSWLYQIVDAQTRFRGFLVPTLAVIGIVGICSRLGILSVGKKAKGSRWVVICSEREKRVLLNGLREWERSKSDFHDVESFKSEIMPNARMNVAIGEDIGPGEIGYFYLARLRASGYKVVRLTDWCEMALQRIPSELIDEKWFLLSEGFAIQPGRIWWRVKRVGDVVLSLILAVMTLPLVAVACAAIWLGDQGPMFYSQVRTGIYGARIKIWKLRSMKVNAEKDGAKWAVRDDKRVTRVGKIIRKTRIDELPQLWSVVIGDLSLIGPRPERPEIENKLEEYIENYRTREWIRPGLSGWAQVSYPYGASLNDTKMKLSYDLYYLKNAGLLMDIFILLKTIRLVIRAEGSNPSN